jgi:thiopurine S-methyltransferase
MKTSFDKNYWDQKYLENKTGWDIGAISTPIKGYIDQLTNKELKILIPGAGNGYEVEYLFNAGFTNITVLDIAEQPLLNLKNRIPNFPTKHLIHTNFFDHNLKYNLILEQTFFCALDPILRTKYAEKMNELLVKNGKIAGLLFDFEFTENGPPFGGSLAEYKVLFSKYFKIITLERCYNSIKPRNGNELFFIFEKK